MPAGRIIPFPTFFNTVLEVPLDDEHTATCPIDTSPAENLNMKQLLKRSGPSEERFYKGNSVMARPGNGLGQDHQAMKRRQSWSGFQGITQEDSVVSCSMGPIYDRTKERW